MRVTGLRDFGICPLPSPIFKNRQWPTFLHRMLVVVVPLVCHFSCSFWQAATGICCFAPLTLKVSRLGSIPLARREGELLVILLPPRGSDLLTGLKNDLTAGRDHYFSPSALWLSEFYVTSGRRGGWGQSFYNGATDHFPSNYATKVARHGALLSSSSSKEDSSQGKQPCPREEGVGQGLFELCELICNIWAF